MIFVDTSVWIDYFNGNDTAATDRLDAALQPREGEEQAREVRAPPEGRLEPPPPQVHVEEPRAQKRREREDAQVPARMSITEQS